MAMTKLDTHIICVGAVYIDTIWTVPFFPKEDTKLRAEKVTRRRGGNVGNTLEVLSDILAHAPADSPQLSKTLHLIAVLPDADSQDAEYIRESIPEVRLMGPFREGQRYAASSMIIQSRKEDTRTIVSHGSNLPEMTCVECVDKFGLIIAHLDAGNKTWIHFEGRAPQVTNDCVKEIQNNARLGKESMISIECENPERKGLENAARFADVVFYSKLWAEELYDAKSAVQFLEQQLLRTKYEKPNVILICTWGAKGAAAVKIIDNTPQELEWAKCDVVWNPPKSSKTKVVDTIGAGDTFIAGMIYCLTNHPNTTLEQKLGYAIQIASRKVYQDGFGGLGKAMKGVLG